MQKIMYVEGMMCAHCEARVRKALEALPFVEKAEPDHSAGPDRPSCFFRKE